MRPRPLPAKARLFRRRETSERASASVRQEQRSAPTGNDQQGTTVARIAGETTPGDPSGLTRGLPVRASQRRSPRRGVHPSVDRLAGGEGATVRSEGDVGGKGRVRSIAYGPGAHVSGRRRAPWSRSRSRCCLRRGLAIAAERERAEGRHRAERADSSPVGNGGPIRRRVRASKKTTVPSSPRTASVRPSGLSASSSRRSLPSRATPIAAGLRSSAASRMLRVAGESSRFTASRASRSERSRLGSESAWAPRRCASATRACLCAWFLCCSATRRQRSKVPGA